LNKQGGGEFTVEDIALAEEIAEHLHAEIDRVFVTQQILNQSERLSNLFGRLITAAAAVFGVAVLFLLLTILWGGVSRLFAG
jgi:GAF domain-containing protein